VSRFNRQNAQLGHKALAGWLFVLLLSSGCAPSQAKNTGDGEASGPALGDEGAIVGGHMTHAYGAVGRIMVRLVAPASPALAAVREGCTGTLIARRVILTAKHCFVTPGGTTVDKIPVTFRLGTDYTKPDR